MSMIGNFFAIKEGRANELMSNPDSVADFLYSEESPIDESEDFLDIDKSCHGIHYILTGEVSEGLPPARDVIMGGKAIGKDVGYGPARFLDTEEVKNVNKYLSDIESSYIKENYNPKELKKKKYTLVDGAMKTMII